MILLWVLNLRNRKKEPKKYGCELDINALKSSEKFENNCIYFQSRNLAIKFYIEDFWADRLVDSIVSDILQDFLYGLVLFLFKSFKIDQFDSIQ